MDAKHYEQFRKTRGRGRGAFNTYNVPGKANTGLITFRTLTLIPKAFLPNISLTPPRRAMDGTTEKITGGCMCNQLLEERGTLRVLLQGPFLNTPSQFSGRRSCGLFLTFITLTYYTRF